jgi:hypothetical protein
MTDLAIHHQVTIETVRHRNCTLDSIDFDIGITIAITITIIITIDIRGGLSAAFGSMNLFVFAIYAYRIIVNISISKTYRTVIDKLEWL